MVGRDIVLIDSFLYQTHPKHVRVEIIITARVRRDRCEMVDTVELHETPYTIRIRLPTRTGEVKRTLFSP